VFLTALVTQPLRYIAVEREALRALLVEDGPLSDLVLATFIARREALQRVQGIGLEIVGPHSSEATMRMVDFARAFFTNERPVFAICHGPQLLMTARVVRGRRMTAWTTVQDDLDQVGADVVDEEVVVDRRLVTSRKPDDVPAFSREAVRMLETATAARR